MRRRRASVNERPGLFPSGEVDGNKDEILEGASPEQRPVVSANTNRLSAQELEESIELVERRLLASSDQGVGQRDQQLPGAVTVDIGVSSPEIAQCLLDPVRARLQEGRLVSGVPAGGGNGQADFERHVEPRCAAGELNPTEVVKEYRHAEISSRMRSSRRIGPGISSVARGRSPKAQRPAISATKSFSYRGS